MADCANGGRFTAAAGLFAPGQYSAASNQAHLVMSIAALSCTLGFGLHSIVRLPSEPPPDPLPTLSLLAQAVGGWPEVTPQWLHARHGAYFVSAASFITAGVYLFLRVLFLCDGCLSSGYTMRDIVQQCAPPS